MKELENVSSEFINKLNEVIRVGKRYIKQKDTLIDPLEKRIKELREKILDVMESFRTKHFSISRNKEYSSLFMIKIQVKSCVNEYSIPLLHFWERAIHCVDLIPYTIAGAYNVSKKNLPPQLEALCSEITEEVFKYIDEIKKAIALTFYEFKKRSQYYDKIIERFNDKGFRTVDLQNELEVLWREKEHRIPEGASILFKASKGNFWVKGKLQEIRTTFFGQELIIKSNVTGRNVTRWRGECEFEGKFEDTDLYKNLVKLTNLHEIPECWKENRLDFYS